MENTMNTAVEAMEAAVNTGNKEVMYFFSGMFLGAVIATGVGYSVRAIKKVKKAKKPIEANAEVVEIEE